MAELLFNRLASEFRIARVTADDAKRRTDLWHDLRRLIVDCEAMYPKIDRWVDNKVSTGLESGRRGAFVGYHGGVPVVSSVVKRGAHAKFCHLKVDERFRSSNIGEFFFALMTLEAGERALKVHFTLPESLWEEKKQFFASFAFRCASKHDKQYRLFEEELHCAAPFEQIWRSVARKLSKLSASMTVDNCSQDSELLMSVRPQHADSILNGLKKVEVRRSFSSKWLGSRIALYAAAPVSSVVGEAVVEDIVEDTPEKVWSKYYSQLGCTKEEFDAYASKATTVYALVLADVRTYAKPMPLGVARNLTQEPLTPPQNYAKLTAGSPWSRALPIASLLQTVGAPVGYQPYE